MCVLALSAERAPPPGTVGTLIALQSWSLDPLSNEGEVFESRTRAGKMQDDLAASCGA